MKITKINCILMRTVAVLLVLVLVTTNMVSGRLARYVTTASYEDKARVARFNIVEEGKLSTQIQKSINPGVAVEAIKIKNCCEVAVEYTVTVNNVYHNLPLRFEIWDADNKVSLASANDTDGIVTLTGVVTPTQWDKNLQLRIIWPVDATNINYCGRVDLIQVTLDAVQID